MNATRTNDCPICLEAICDSKNHVTTDCGHSFHTNCLMTSVAHNGFGCPYCRAVMAEVPEDEDEDEEEYEEDSEDEYVMRGMRWLFQRANNEELDEDEDDEDEEEDETDATPKPTVELITRKLAQQGVTMEQLIKIVLLEHPEYESNEDEYDDVGNELFGKIRVIISNYNPADEAPKDTPVQVVDSFYENRFLRVV